MKIKTSELTNGALDYAVAKCEGASPRYQTGFVTLSSINYLADWDSAEEYSPSTDWAQGGPIIEREAICVGSGMDAPTWYANMGFCNHHQFGESPLIAAMRCLVASKLGDEVDIPEGLL